MSETSMGQRRKLAAILMADVSGFSRLMGRDEEGTTRRIRDFHERVARHVAAHDGRVVDTAGDSVFGEFDSVVEAVRCARVVQEDQARSNAGVSDTERIDTRIGVHLGDVIVEDGHVFGDGVNIAARLEGIADPGGIYVSEAVHQQVHNKLDLEFEDLGTRELKNIDHPLRVFRVPPEQLGNPALAPEVRSARALVAGNVEPVRNLRRRRTRREELEHRRESRRERRRSPQQRSLAADLLRPVRVGLWLPGLALLAAPFAAITTAGLFPAGGAVLVGLAGGLTWRARGNGQGGPLVGLGLALLAGAVFTDWSRITNGLFVLAGLCLIVLGFVSNVAGREAAGDSPPRTPAA